MKSIQKIVLLTSILLLAANSYAGRWLTRDPIGFMELDPRPTISGTIPSMAFDDPQQINLYAYVLNNPINYIDPLGLDGEATLGLDPTLLMDEEETAAYNAKKAADAARACERAKEIKKVRDAEDAINKAKDIQKAQSKDPLKINRINKSDQNMKKELRDIMNDHNNP